MNHVVEKPVPVPYVQYVERPIHIPYFLPVEVPVAYHVPYIGWFTFFIVEILIEIQSKLITLLAFSDSETAPTATKATLYH